MIDSRLRFSPDAERNLSHDVVHDRFDFWRNFTALGVGENGEVTACDIEPDSGKRNCVFVGDDSTNRLGVTFVAIRAKNSALSTSVDTILDLPQRRLIVLAKYFRLHSQAALSIMASSGVKSKDV